VHKFFLSGSKAPYFVKLRPGFDIFLKEISQYFEIHVYTMGVRRYAEKVISLFDNADAPAIKQLIARDDYPEDPHTKTLNRLFKVDENRTIILDDRIDVWANPRRVLHIHKYTFWPESEDRSGRHIFGFTSIRCRKVITISEQTKLRMQLYHYWKDMRITKMKFNTRGVQVFTAQTPGDKTLRKLEKKLNEKDRIPCKCEYIVNLEELKRRDGDEVLSCVRRVLTDIYKLSLEKDMDSIKLLSAVKSRTFRGLRFVFSGIIPRGESPWESTIWMKAEEFGAKCYEKLTSDNEEGVTHVICDRAGTDKVNLALKLNLYIVHINWFWNSVVHFMRSNEEFYCLPKLEYANRKRGPKKKSDSTTAEVEAESDPLSDIDTTIPERSEPVGDEIAVVESLDAAKTKFSFMNDSDDEAKPDTADAAETKTNIIQVNNEIPEDLHPQKASEESEPAREDAKMEAGRSGEAGEAEVTAPVEVPEPPMEVPESMEAEENDEEISNVYDINAGLTANLDDDLFDDMIDDESDDENEKPAEVPLETPSDAPPVEIMAVDEPEQVEGIEAEKVDKGEVGEVNKVEAKEAEAEEVEKVEGPKEVKSEKKKKKNVIEEEDDPDMDFNLLENLTSLTRKDPSEIKEVIVEAEVDDVNQDIVPKVSEDEEEEADSYDLSVIDKLLEKTKPKPKTPPPEEPKEVVKETVEEGQVEVDLTKPPEVEDLKGELKNKEPEKAELPAVEKEEEQDEEEEDDDDDESEEELAEAPALSVQESQSASTSSDLLFAAQELIDNQVYKKQRAAAEAARLAEAKVSRSRKGRRMAAVEIREEDADDEEEFNYGIIKRTDGKDSSDEEEDFDFTLFDTTKDTKKLNPNPFASFRSSGEKKRKKWI